MTSVHGWMPRSKFIITHLLQHHSISKAGFGLLATVLFCSCVSGARPPNAPVQGRLSLGGADAKNQDISGPLKVVFAAPQGDTTQETEITLVFNKPMRSLTAPPNTPASPAVLAPELAGSWQWIGSTALRFNAKAPFPNATQFRVS